MYSYWQFTVQVLYMYVTNFYFITVETPAGISSPQQPVFQNAKIFQGKSL